MSDYNKMRDIAREAREYAAGITPQQYLLNKIEVNEKLKIEVNERNKLKIDNAENHLIQNEIGRKNMLSLIELEKKRKNLKAALDFINYEDEINALEITYKVVEDYKISLNAFKASHSDFEIWTKLTDDEKAYRQLWLYHVLHTFTPKPFIPSDERIKEILDFILSELEKMGNVPTNKNLLINEATRKYQAKHYLLAYLFECNAKGESFPIGNKKELESIGNERIGAGKGNTFYKAFNKITIKYDLNNENHLIEIGGENWRKAIIELSKAPELVEKYLQSKQL